MDVTLYLSLILGDFLFKNCFLGGDFFHFLLKRRYQLIRRNLLAKKHHHHRHRHRHHYNGPDNPVCCYVYQDRMCRS